MSWRQTRRYDSEVDAPRRGRSLCRSHLTVVMGDRPEVLPVLDQAELIVSELITNSISSGCDNLLLSLNLYRDHLDIAVDDDGPPNDGLRIPIDSDRDQALTDARALSIEIVDRVAQDWGAEFTEHGTHVWATLAVSPQWTNAMTGL
jgi:hypothetical protein